MHKFPSIDYVMSLTPGGMKEGRDNVIKIMKILGNPQDTLRVFHVTGSNGKGSVCQMLSQVLWKKFGKKVGLFTSPHFIDISERFQINGRQISKEKLDTYYEKVVQLGEKYDILLSFFEIQVVVMVLYFCDEKVDYAVVEVGLGGTYDGTNIFHNPIGCFITSITREHTHVLGKTKRSILKNKLGIVKPGARLYTPIQNQLVREYCEKNDVFLSPFPYKKNELTNLPGKHQQKNAISVLQALKDEGFEEKIIKEGLKNIYNPGRFQWLSPNILVDTANNEENIRLLARMIHKTGQTNIISLFGTTQVDPQYARQLANMIPVKQRYIVDNFCDRSLPASKYGRNNKNEKIIHFEEINQKWLQDKQRWGENILLVYGSFYLVGEIMRLSRYEPFATE